MTEIKMEPTREHWTPFAPWMRDVLADDARVSWVSSSRAEWRHLWERLRSEDDDWCAHYRVHPDDVPERPAPDDALAEALYNTDSEEDGPHALPWGEANEFVRDAYRLLARAAREHIDNEPDDALVDSSQQVRAEKAEKDRDRFRGRLNAQSDRAGHLSAENKMLADEIRRLEADRDAWKAKHAAHVLDLDDARGKA